MIYLRDNPRRESDNQVLCIRGLKPHVWYCDATLSTVMTQMYPIATRHQTMGSRHQILQVDTQFSMMVLYFVPLPCCKMW